jgi:hypothetical protein
MREPVWPRCASAFLGPSAGLRKLPAPRACDYSRLSDVTHLRPSASPTGSGVLQPLNLLCEAFSRRDLDSSGGALLERTPVFDVRHEPRPLEGREDARGKI